MLKKIYILILLFLCNTFVLATDQWRVFGPGTNLEVKSMYSQPPFCKWHKLNIGYSIVSSPNQALNYLIDNSFNSWAGCGYINFTSGSDITVNADYSNPSWFGYTPFTCDSHGEIVSCAVYLNTGSYDGVPITWTDGNENVAVSGATRYYCDVQNCVTHELGHALGIAHHSTGNGNPTMAERSLCPIFNTTLDRRTLEPDDWAALNFLYHDLFIPSEYTSCSTAISCLPDNGVVSVQQNSILDNNVTIPTSKTISIQTGVTLNLNGYYIVFAGGTMTIASGATFNCAYLKSGNNVLGYFPTIQSAVNYFSGGSSTSLYTIALQPRAYNESVTFSGKSYMVLDGLGSATINSLAINNSSSIYIENLTVNNSQIQINGSSHTDISGVTVTFGAGIVYDYNGTLTNFYNSYGTNGGASEGYNSYCGTGNIFSNHISGWDIGVYLQNGASYTVGQGNVFCGNGGDIVAYSPSHAYCTANKYSRTPYPISGNYEMSGEINGLCGDPKAARKQIAGGNNTTESVTGGNDLIQQYLNLLQQMKTDKENGVVNTASYVETVGTIIGKLMVKFVTAFDKDSFKKNIVFLSQLYNTIGAKTDFNNALAILSGNKLFSNYLPFIKRYEIGTDIDNRDYKKAADLTNTIMADKNTDTGLLCEMLYEKGLIYKNYLNDTVTAKAAFTELAVNHSDNILSKFALAQLGQSGGGSLGKQVSPLAGTETQKAITGFGNYPNPFNPTTKICYPVEQAGAIKLSVYNLLGQRVAELVNCYMEKGNYTVDFDGSKLASGLYIYTLQSGNKFTSRKMFLLK